MRFYFRAFFKYGSIESQYILGKETIIRYINIVYYRSLIAIKYKYII